MIAGEVDRPKMQLLRQTRTAIQDAVISGSHSRHCVISDKRTETRSRHHLRVSEEEGF